MPTEVTLVFSLDEDVTPAIFIQRIATGCARSGALRPGESVSLPDRSAAWQIHEPVEMDVFGHGRKVMMPYIKSLS
jgi:hypothetical protein